MPEKDFLIGIDIGGTNIKIGLFKKDGKLVEKWQVQTDKIDHGSKILTEIVYFADKNIFDKTERSKIIGVGIGVPGPVDSKGVVHKCVNLGWDVFNIKEEFEKLIMLPVAVENDANVAALGEMWQGSGKNKKSLIMATIGTGIGGGVILNGKIVSGFHGSAGEIGHITVDENEKELCSCGKKGCAEQYASATGMVKYTKKLIEDGIYRTGLSQIQDLTGKDIIEAAKKKDAVALKAIDKMGWALGLSLANAACVFDPEIVIIGGGVSKGGDIVLKSIQKYYKKFAFHTMVDTPFVTAKLGNDAGIYGAAGLLL